MARQLGFIKQNDKFPAINSEGFLETATYRWDPTKQNFYLKNNDGSWVKYTWHHHQDGRTMYPVPSNVHNASEKGFGHSGGNSLIEADSNGA